MSKGLDLRSYDVRQVQCALAAQGADIDVDGAFGPRTQAALDAALRAYQGTSPNSTVAQGARYQAAPMGSSTVTMTSGFAYWLFNGAPECREQSASRGAMQPTGSSSSSAPISLTLPFWRRDNWKAWAVGLAAAAVMGGAGYYVYRRWMR